jgi:hypothetical protein
MGAIHKNLPGPIRGTTIPTQSRMDYLSTLLV